MKLSEMSFSDGSVPVVFKDGQDITGEIEKANGKSNPFGWSSMDLIRVQNVNGARLEEKIGSLYCGYPLWPEPDYKFFQKDAKGVLTEWK